MGFRSKEEAAAYQKEYRQRNKEHLKKQKNEYWRKNRDKHAFKSLRDKAVSKGICFDIKFEDIDFPTHCPVLGMKLERCEPGQGRANPNSPSIDKIKPELGYVKGNVQVMSTLANAMKQNATPEQLIAFAEWVLRTYKKGDTMSETESPNDKEEVL